MIEENICVEKGNIIKKATITEHIAIMFMFLKLMLIKLWFKATVTI